MPSQRWSRLPCSTACHCAWFATNSATCALSPGWSGNPKIGYAKSLMDYIARWLELRFLTGDQGELFNALPMPIQQLREANDTDPVGALGELIQMGDAPACNICGSLMVRSGTCYRCMTCGSTSGCS